VAAESDPTQSWRSYGPLELPPILRHALEAFVEHGYHATSVRDISRRLGQTVPAIYYHYENKQALLVALLRRSMDDVLSRCRSAAEEAGEDPVRRFASLVECVVLYIAHRRQLAFLDAEMRSLEPKARVAYAAHRDELEMLVREAVTDAVAQHRFTTGYPTQAARAVLTMCLGVATWYRPTGPLPPDELAQQYVGFALGLVGNRPS
jgi:AcrR family transcriptional regulator